MNEVKDTIRTASKIAEKMGVRQERAGREYGRGQEKVSSNLNEAIAPIKTASKIAEKMGVSEKTAFGKFAKSDKETIHVSDRIV